MPVRLLTDAQREQLSAFPSEVPDEDLYAFFTLTEERDRELEAEAGGAEP